MAVTERAATAFVNVLQTLSPGELVAFETVSALIHDGDVGSALTLVYPGQTRSIKDDRITFLAYGLAVIGAELKRQRTTS